jgi:hypothetical protein
VGGELARPPAAFRLVDLADTGFVCKIDPAGSPALEAALPRRRRRRRRLSPEPVDEGLVLA